MADPRDSVELSIVSASVPPTAAPNAPPGPSKPFLRVFFKCANAYVRAGMSPAGDSYLARCPACGQTKRFVVGPGGTDQRSFMLSCR